MSFLSSLLAWANAPFTVVLGVALGFALLQMTGLLGLLAGGGDHEGDADHDADGGHDGGHDADHDADGDHDADHEGEGQGLGQQIVAGLGVGRVPLSIVWQTYAVSFGFAGIALNTMYLGSARVLPASTLMWTLPLALLFGYVVTRLLSRFLGRLASDPRQEATSRRQLVGLTGVVISTKVDAEFGEIRVRDKTGHVLRVICRTRHDTPIPEGRVVVIVEHDRERDHLYVTPLDEDEAKGPS